MPSGNKPLPEAMVIELYVAILDRILACKQFKTLAYYVTPLNITMENSDPICNIDLGQHWLSLWLVAWWHQAITWTEFDLSSEVLCGIPLSTISQEVPMNLIRNNCSRDYTSKLLPQPIGANESKLSTVRIQLASACATDFWHSRANNPDICRRESTPSDILMCV